ncbi:adenylate/guanylate cyclase domain-containing protein [Winogradskyella sp. PG-2]|uniref:adenylate/guanylate cyclase domain-containing protein n=1 Tax=Winogradskyella sp. PG-2 TaxID=754409 RepID=UPI0004588AA5|nr:adenylate/guanylate cyclase domain-containing protein [Winogradskyella sp. PG-2]BAO75497.1 adenylate cyclase [Winogradskyella sp. PG-2]
MFTDIEDYTALMQRDEKQAIAIRKRHCRAFEITTEAYNGKVVQYFGDGTLSIFTSSVEAVKCAIELQRAFLEAPKIPVRIGIHVGDILYTEEDIIGDAVNVASRIEACAVSGSVLVSDKVHDQIRSHQDIKVQFLDAYELKNVDEAMLMFTIANDNLVVPKPEDVKGKLKEKLNKTNSKTISKKKALFLGIFALVFLCSAFFSYQYFNKQNDISKELSIAVLPFDNLSTDDDAEIFRDGITEDILTQLSKLKELRVISRTSVMQYKDTEKTIPEIAEELGVSYVLEGSIRKYGNDLRITAQSIDASADEHLWAENYDKTLTDIFNLQTEVSNEIVKALEINLSFEEQQQLAVVPTKNIEAFKLFLKGRDEADKRNKESIANSILLYKETIALDPNYAEAYAEIANSIYLEAYYSNRHADEASKLANEYLVKAEKINDKTSRIYSVRGVINNYQGNHEGAVKAFERAIELSPNDLTARYQYSTFFFYTGQTEKQIEQAEIAYRLDPLSFPIANSYFNALLTNKEFDRAQNLIDKIQARNDGNNQFVINRSYFRLYMDQKKYKKTIPYLKKTDSVLFYLDTLRNKLTRRLVQEHDTYFNYLQENEHFKEILKMHGID